MSILDRTGSLFDSDAPAIAHGVNCKGAMGAGIAVAFRTSFPDMYERYAALCSRDELAPGGVFYWEGDTAPAVYNLASQSNPGADARIDWLTISLRKALRHAAEKGYDRIAIPQIGCGIGGLRWTDVRVVVERLSNEHGVDVEVWAFPE